MKLLLILLSLKSVYSINQTNFKSIKHNSSGNSGSFEQDINLVFYENLNECLNNGEILKISNTKYNKDCNCLNSNDCMNKVCNSSKFKNHIWEINNHSVYGKQCQFKSGRICDTCGDYSVKTRVTLFGISCYNNQLYNFLFCIFIITLSVLFSIACVSFSQSVIRNSIPRRRFGRSKGYSSINNVEPPPEY